MNIFIFLLTLQSGLGFFTLKCELKEKECHLISQVFEEEKDFLFVQMSLNRSAYCNEEDKFPKGKTTLDKSM